MARLAEERKNLVDNVKKLDEAMLGLRAVAGTSPQVAADDSRRLAAARRACSKSVGVDGPQQLDGLHRTSGRDRNGRDIRGAAPRRRRAGTAAAVTAPAAGGVLCARRTVDAEIGRGPRRPRRRSPGCCRWPTCRRAGSWASRARSTSRRSTPTTCSRRSTAAPRASSSTTSRGWRTPITTRPATSRTRSSFTSSRWATPSRPSGKYGSEKPDEAKPVADRVGRIHVGRQHALLCRARITPRSSRPRTTPSSRPSSSTWPSGSPRSSAHGRDGREASAAGEPPPETRPRHPKALFALLPRRTGKVGPEVRHDRRLRV